MKRRIRLFTTLMVCMAMALCVSCKKDKDNNVPADLIGSWYGEGYPWSCDITFNSDNTFTSEAESVHGAYDYTAGTFSVKGSTITCTGYYNTVYSNGEVNTGDYNHTFTYHQTYLTGGRFAIDEYVKYH
ncbi:MAG: hypothetical protein MJZ78_04185 [Bacteroidales bacterium]|nr:hypothetical protein [Bacteroidales bacterium]